MKKFRSKLLITFGLIGTFIIIISFKTEKTHKSSNQTVKDTLSITVLQTADIHGQLDTHPELFWENEEIVFKNRGGLANIKTLFERERKMNPGKTLIVDGGDLIQGSGYAALSEGKVIPDIIKNMGYDVIIPGNWEVVYGKEVMLDVMKNYDTKVIAHNMHHEETGEDLFPPYWIKEIEGVRIGCRT
jgi:5'-nucleotidase|tara:strand:+ start:823 stop:1383 length:561 start_codon:yes stop_codon:yes gene_type:complete